MKSLKLLENIGALPANEKWQKHKSLLLKGVVGSSLSAHIAYDFARSGGVHLVACEDKEAAGYLYYDLLGLVGAKKILFFPTGYKRSVVYATEDPSGIVQRTAVLEAIDAIKDGNGIIICSYPEALAEKVAGRDNLQENLLLIAAGDKISQSSVVSRLGELGFERVDFVYSPGQYSLRGGILDIFSFSSNQPYRLDFFGDEVDSIRIFDINTQLSTEKRDEIKIVPNLKHSDTKSGVSLPLFISQSGVDASFWVVTPERFFSRILELRTQLIKERESKNESISDINALLAGEKEISEVFVKSRRIAVFEDFKDKPSERTITFNISSQPAFNKNFELLAQNLIDNTNKGYKNFLITENKAQVERLEAIFESINSEKVRFDNISLTLHEGFVDHDLKICLYTDHQIFERYHRYRLEGELPKAERMTIAELGAMSPGDYVVHIDHGIGRFGGLVRSSENGKTIESVKLTYKDGDVLLVSVHSLHKISKYKDKDTEGIPKIHKLGSGIWQRQKLSAKNKVKDIAKDLIKLYAKRQATKGFAYSPDGYMQNELEASFIYEDTPDQQKATEAFKRDMEVSTPMDRLVCGDVGFGKTEIAMRASFKAVCDGKQVAVLVPTTVLALQHNRSFKRRLKEFPVTVECLSRSRTAKEVTDIRNRLKDGKIDILIGTHKILSKTVEFKDLGLLIIDEEQKFGVSSKEKLREMRENIDTLTLTATPIPRTLQFSLMGARDLSVINTPPPNRQPVATEVHSFSEELIREAIEQELSRGGQVFFVHNRIDTIGHIQGIINKLVPQARTAIGHGRLPADKLEKIMTEFIFGEYDVLIATTIVESGIDIPNANTIIINDAHNYGLSDLHQLRGRVGRTNRKAYCYLLSPGDDCISDTARRRLRAIEEFSELGAGFNIAMQDLDIRGAGNLLGAEQSGFIADIGFETYRKILTEAMMELRDEIESTSDIEIHPKEVAQLPGRGYTADNSDSFVSDCTVETDVEAFIPDSYVSSVNEKMRLYRAIDELSSESDAEELRNSLVDRFGTIPKPVEQLLNIVSIRRYAIRLGFEKAIIKNGYMIVHLVSNQSSKYYKSRIFTGIMQFLGNAGGDYKFKQRVDKLLISIKGVNTTDKAVSVLKNIEESIKSSQKLFEQ